VIALPRARARRAPARKPRRSLALAGSLLLAAIGIALPFAWGRNSPCQEIAVPAYFYPGADWTRAINSRPVPSMMILDITSSGAGSAPDPNYQAAVKRAQAAGIEIIGYSNTSYTRRPAAAVEADVRNYKAWYDVTDIFLDQATSNSSGIAYYRQLTNYIHDVNPGSTVILNPGTYPDQQYMSLGDIVMVYENTYAHYAGLRVPSWADKYPAAKFAYAIYAATAAQLGRAISLSWSRHAGYVYVTDRTGSNPYSALPGYWSREDAIIAARCAGAARSAS
jgi:Spherulation-specific family 4